MIKKILLILCLMGFSYAEDNLAAQKQNVLYVQTLIQIEENITKMFEKYILTEYKIPTLTDLSTDDYLGSNFSTINRMGADISFEDTKNLKIKYAITKSGYRKKSDENSDIQNYIVQLYNRDLYRNTTSAYDGSENDEASYVQMVLQSNEAKTIFELLKNNFTIEKECSSTLKEVYCNNKNNIKTIRWYNNSSKWIEYDKDSFNKGNISTTMTLSEIIAEPKISDLVVGAYVFISSERYAKLTNDSSGKIEILKVD